MLLHRVGTEISGDVTWYLQMNTVEMQSWPWCWLRAGGRHRSLAAAGGPAWGVGRPAAWPGCRPAAATRSHLAAGKANFWQGSFWQDFIYSFFLLANSSKQPDNFVHLFYCRNSEDKSTGYVLSMCKTNVVMRKKNTEILIELLCIFLLQTKFTISRKSVVNKYEK